jgi:hypothetical protein
MRSTTVTSEAERPMLDALLDDPVATASAPTAATALAEPPAVLGLAAAPAFWPDGEPEDVVASSFEPDDEVSTASETDVSEATPPPVATSIVERAALTWPAPPAASASPVAPPPGSYLPPTAAPPPPPVLGTAALATAPAGPAAPARASAGPGADAAVARDTPAADPEASAARLRAAEMIGWIGIAGCALALLGFLVPWARTMIGSAGAGYLDQWGLAGPGHVLIVLGLGLILVGALLPERIPLWLRLGIPGLVVGSLLVGLVWPYVFGPLGTLPGAYLTLAGALTLIGAAVASLVVDRHAAGGSAV